MRVIQPDLGNFKITQPTNKPVTNSKPFVPPPVTGTFGSTAGDQTATQFGFPTTMPDGTLAHTAAPTITNPHPTPAPWVPHIGNGKITVGANHPDYAAGVAGDQGYQALLAGLGTHGQALNATRHTSIQRALAAAGITPDFNDKYGDVDQALKDLIGTQNSLGLTEHAQQAHAHGQALDDLRASFAARGLLSGGQSNRSQIDENTNYNGQLSSSASKLLDFIGQQEGDYANGLAGDASQQAQGLNDAFARQTQLNPTSNGVDAFWNDDKNAYVDGMGNLYDASGNHVGYS